MQNACYSVVVYVGKQFRKQAENNSSTQQASEVVETMFESVLQCHHLPTIVSTQQHRRVCTFILPAFSVFHKRASVNLDIFNLADLSSS
jgi:hypothetical protein